MANKKLLIAIIASALTGGLQAKITNILNPVDVQPYLVAHTNNKMQFRVNSPLSADNQDSGYQALKDGLLLVQATTDNEARSSALNNLVDTQVCQNFFGTKDALWKKYITTLRQKSVAYVVINQVLKDLIAENLTSKKLSADDALTLLKVLPILNLNMIEMCTTTEAGTLHYAFDKNALIEFLKKNHRFTFKDDKAIDSFIASFCNTVTLEVTTEESCDLKINDKVQTVNIKQNEQQSSSTLFKAELAALYNYTIEQKYFNTPTNVRFCCVSKIPTTETLKKSKELKEIHEDLNNPRSSFVSLLLIEENNSWIPCVINKQEEKIQYLLAHPSNLSLLDNQYVLSILKVLESKKELIAYSDATKAKRKEASPLLPNEGEGKANKAQKRTFVVPAKTLEDYAGGVPQTVKDVILQIKNKELAQKLGAKKLPSLMLLYGPPGTGKSTLAEIIAGETQSYFIKISAAELLNKYYGEGVKELKSLFEQAREIYREQNKNVIIFIDEIDSILVTEDSEMGQRTDLRHAFNTQLDLNESHVFCIAATNRFDKIDATTKTRCGNYTIEIPAPDKAQRKAIVGHYLRNINLDDSKLQQKLTNQTNKFSPRELEFMIHHAAIVALRDNKDKITEAHIQQALKETLANRKKSAKDQSKWFFTDPKYKKGLAIAITNSVIMYIVSNELQHKTITNYCKKTASKLGNTLIQQLIFG